MFLKYLTPDKQYISTAPPNHCLFYFIDKTADYNIILDVGGKNPVEKTEIVSICTKHYIIVLQCHHTFDNIIRTANHAP